MNWSEQIQEAWGIHPIVIDFIGMRLCEDDTRYVEYPVSYPGKVNYLNNTVINDVTWRKRLLPQYANSGLLKSINPSTDDMPGGQMPPLYVVDYKSLREDVEASGGIIYLLEGDKDTWSFYSADVANAAGLITANHSINDRLFIILKDMGVKSIIHIVDSDRAGWDGAELLNELSKRHRIVYTPMGLPYGVNGVRIKDAADLWKQLNFDVDQFRHYLTDVIKPIVLPSQFHKKIAKEGNYFDEELYNLIEEQLGVSTFSSIGWSESVPHPGANHEHDDTDPAFGWNHDSRVARCFKCNSTFLAKDVADMLGIDWRKYVTRNSNIKDIPTIENTGADQTKDDAGKQFEKESFVANALINGFTENNPYNHFDLRHIGYSIQDEALDNYSARLAGTVTSEFPPIINPIRTIHGLGGLAHVMSRPLMIALFGMSGGYKTSILHAVSLELSRQGYHGIVWSPEWDMERTIDRTVQYHDGMHINEMSLHERFLWEQRLFDKGLRDKISVDPTEPLRIEQSWKAVHRVKRELKGKIFYINQFGANALEVLQMVDAACEKMIEAGMPPSYFIFDYIQLATKPKSIRDWNDTDTIIYTKALTIRRGLVTWMSSQVTKESTRSAKNDDMDVLDSTSGLYIRDDQYNLVLTSRPIQAHIPFNGQMYKVIRLGVVKNSLGDVGDNDLTAPFILVDESNHSVIFPDTDTDIRRALNLG